MSSVQDIHATFRVPAGEGCACAYTNLFSTVNFGKLGNGKTPIQCEFEAPSALEDHRRLAISYPTGFVENTFDVVKGSNESPDLRAFLKIVTFFEAAEASGGVSEHLKRAVVDEYEKGLADSRSRYETYLAKFEQYCAEREGKKRTQKMRGMEVGLDQLREDLELRTKILRSARLGAPYLGFHSIVTWNDTRGGGRRLDDRFCIYIDKDFPEMSPEELMKADLVVSAKAHLKSVIGMHDDKSPDVRYYYSVNLYVVSVAPKFA